MYYVDSTSLARRLHKAGMPLIRSGAFQARLSESIQKAFHQIARKAIAQSVIQSLLSHSQMRRPPALSGKEPDYIH